MNEYFYNACLKFSFAVFDTHFDKIKIVFILDCEFCPKSYFSGTVSCLSLHFSVITHIFDQLISATNGGRVTIGFPFDEGGIFVF